MAAVRLLTTAPFDIVLKSNHFILNPLSFTSIHICHCQIARFTFLLVFSILLHREKSLSFVSSYMQLSDCTLCLYSRFVCMEKPLWQGQVAIVRLHALLFFLVLSIRLQGKVFVARSICNCQIARFTLYFLACVFGLLEGKSLCSEVNQVVLSLCGELSCSCSRFACREKLL